MSQLETIAGYWDRAAKWLTSIGLDPGRITRQPIDITADSETWWFHYTELMLDSDMQIKRDRNGNPNFWMRSKRLDDYEVDDAIKLRLVKIDPKPVVCEHCGADRTQEGKQ